MNDFKTEAVALRPTLIAWRRDLHQYPETAFEEVRTAGIVAAELTRLGMAVQTGVGRTGVVGLLEGAHAGPTILYRADMDALDITEENTVDYASTIPGKMHACGHDGHVAVALGVARMLAARREHLHGRVKFVFQPGEEGAGGALAMIDAGVLEDPVPDVCLGLHLWTPLPLGTVGMADGPVMSGSSIFRLTIQGKGGHGAMPVTTIDPVVCAGQLILALHTIVGRKMDAMAGAVVLSVTGIHTSSHVYNAIPDSVEIKGTFRTFNAYTSEMLEQHIREVSASVCASMGCTCEVMIRHLTIPVINHAEVTARLRPIFAELVGAEKIDSHARTMASEDMAYLMEDIPGAYFFVGASSPARDLVRSHHHPRFDFDEDALPLAAALMASALGDYLLPDGAPAAAAVESMGTQEAVG